MFYRRFPDTEEITELEYSKIFESFEAKEQDTQTLMGKMQELSSSM